MNEEHLEYVPLTSMPLSANTRVFNSHSVLGGEPLAFLVEAGQAIIRRAATSKYLSELEELNNSVVEDEKPSVAQQPQN